MATLKASLADIKTEYVVPEPKTYVFKLDKITPAEATTNGIYRQNFEFKCVIQDDEDHKGKPIFVNIYVHKVNGELNPVALADIKRFYEAIAPEHANDEDPDLDILVGGLFQAEVYHETFTYKTGPNQGKDGVAARINTQAMAAA